jgi:hypothetical protein
MGLFAGGRSKGEEKKPYFVVRLKFLGSRGRRKGGVGGGKSCLLY